MQHEACGHYSVKYTDLLCLNGSAGLRRYIELTLFAHPADCRSAVFQVSRFSSDTNLGGKSFSFSTLPSLTYNKSPVQSSPIYLSVLLPFRYCLKPGG